MKNKGFILINVIVIMVFLNITVMSAYIINKNTSNTSINAIKNNQIQIYEQSKYLLVDSIILDIIKDALSDERLKNKEKIDEEDVITYIRMNIANKYNAYFKNYDEIKNISLNSNIIQNKNYLDVDFFIEYDNLYISNRHYEIVLEDLTQQDITDIKNNTSYKVYEKYKDIIVKNKYNY